MRTLIIDGNLGKDAEVKVSKATGTKYLVFSVANRYFDGKEQKTEWFDVRVFNPSIVEKRADFLKKGRYVIVSGSVSCNISQGSDHKFYLNQSILADSIDFPSVGNHSNSTETHVSTYAEKKENVERLSEAVEKEAAAVETPAYAYASAASDESSDDLPF